VPDTECVQALSESHQNCADTGEDAGSFGISMSEDAWIQPQRVRFPRGTDQSHSQLVPVRMRPVNSELL
jgi:hypothetical protein